LDSSKALEPQINTRLTQIILGLKANTKFKKFKTTKFHHPAYRQAGKTPRSPTVKVKPRDYTRLTQISLGLKAIKT
jgi:hypothetical protein